MDQAVAPWFVLFSIRSPSFPKNRFSSPPLAALPIGIFHEMRIDV
jgi:hypothetical protein